jgi:menaquinone-dependent protoporphyrinogen oxidase
MRILVAYATAFGSTRGIAERIADRLREAGHEVESEPFDHVGNLDSYDAFVLGSAIHGGRWLPEAAAFMEKTFGVLAPRPAWLFSVATIGDESSALAGLPTRFFRRLQKEPQQVAGFRDAIHANGHHRFAGVIEKGQWGRFGGLFLHLMGGRYGDHRNWQEVDAWAGEIARGLAARPAPQRS